MVATSHTLASEVALQVLKDGGNAIDAAVVAGFALAVTQPRSGNIGGGGFLLYAPGDGSAPEAIDYRETAPAGASETMFQDDDGNVVSQRSRFSHQAAGVPGTVAGLALALERHGTLSLREALAPAIRLAQEGFVVPHRFTEGLEQARERLQRWPATKATFYKEDGSAPQPGEVFKQPDLADTLKRIAEHGPEGFYQGKTAQLIVEEMQRHDGLITWMTSKPIGPPSGNRCMANTVDTTSTPCRHPPPAAPISSRSSTSLRASPLPRWATIPPRPFITWPRP